MDVTNKTKKMFILTVFSYGANDSNIKPDFNPLLRNVLKWSDSRSKSCSKCCRIVKVCCQTILRHCEVRD